MIAAGWSLILLPIAIVCAVLGVVIAIHIPGIGMMLLALAGGLTARFVKARKARRG